MKARHLYSYTYILSVPKRFTLDVPNNSPQMKTISVLVSSILWPIKNLMSWAKADQIRKKSKNANSYLATSRLKKKTDSLCLWILSWYSIIKFGFGNKKWDGETVLLCRPSHLKQNNWNRKYFNEFSQTTALLKYKSLH